MTCDYLQLLDFFFLFFPQGPYLSAKMQKFNFMTLKNVAAEPEDSRDEATSQVPWK